MNPFLSFNKREKMERINNLSAAEKFTLRMADFFLANKYSRLFLLGYSFVLHLFVFLMMYKLAQGPTQCGVEIVVPPPPFNNNSGP